MFINLSNNTFLALIQVCLIAIVVICITIIFIVIIIQCGKTKRAEILTKDVTPSKKDELVGKQLENELECENKDKGKIIDFEKFLAYLVKK